MNLMRREIVTDLSVFLPDGLGDLSDIQRAIPPIAKDVRLTDLIERTLPIIPSSHDLYLSDAREMTAVQPERARGQVLQQHIQAGRVNWMRKRS
jgi:hypothetical protein